ncbi:MAG: transaldolase [Deltaproteobacteria bacterium]|nr:transaldolase [Deltaproteobacteria bacterium]
MEEGVSGKVSGNNREVKTVFNLSAGPDIYLDGGNLDQVKDFAKDLLKGFTFNPSLFRKLGVKDYFQHSVKVVEACRGLPVSLEVLDDTIEGIIRQGRILGEIADHVFVKVPVQLTTGQSTAEAVKVLAAEQVRLNITAVFTHQQVVELLPDLGNGEHIISVFAGRIFDLGIDAVSVTRQICETVHQKSQCRVLWASPRMAYDFTNARLAGCDIITMSPDLIAKLMQADKSPEQFSLETVRMFYTDAIAAGYQL